MEQDSDRYQPLESLSFEELNLAQVIVAANAIIAEGGRPTSRSLREKLGDVASISTINKCIREWKSSQQAQLDAALSRQIVSASTDSMPSVPVHDMTEAQAEIATLTATIASLNLQLVAIRRVLQDLQAERQTYATQAMQSSTLKAQLESALSRAVAAEAEIKASRLETVAAHLELAELQSRLVQPHKKRPALK